MSEIPNHATIVTGLGRCGSSLVMRMLHAGGMEVVVDNDYETYESSLGTVQSPAWPECARGKALKVLDVHLSPIALRSLVLGTRYIIVTRNVEQQAKSMRRFMEQQGLADRTTRHGEISLRTWLTRDTQAVKDWVRRCRAEGNVITFELLLIDPLGAAKLLRRFAGRPDLDVEAMAAVVHRRSPRASWGPLAQLEREAARSAAGED